MKNSYTIANDIIVKNLQDKINKETDYFLEIKNNEFNYCKNHSKRFNKLSKNKSTASNTHVPYLYIKFTYTRNI